VATLQQPAGHDVELQTHCPVDVLHCCPAAHAAHAAPPVPHDAFVSEAYASHVVPLQQPLGHEVPSQTHCPVVLLHSWPAEHAAHVAPLAPHEEFDSLESASHVVPVQHPEHDVPPHVHTPLEHAWPLLHGAHAAPAVPHDAFDCEVYASHVVPLQQPLGHEVASQTHLPVLLSHSWPDAQALQVAPPVPHEPFDSEAYASHVPVMPPLQQPFGQVLTSHEHVPLVLSQRPLEHVAQAAPPVPHFVEVSEAYGTHVVPLQQPAGHEVESHTHVPLVVLHSWPDAHAAHAAPPVPHVELDSEAYATHVFPLQQPFGHEVASQTHCPVLVLHSWPAEHAAHVAPLAPHEVFDSLPSGSHVVLLLQHPEQDVPLQVHTPLEHVSPALHAAQAAPAVPHEAVDCEV
jgi:hypothetical protein